MLFLYVYRKMFTNDRQNIVFVITSADKELPFANSSEMCDIMGTLQRKTEIIDTLHCVNIFSPRSLVLQPYFFFVAKWFRERNSFFTVRRFNSTNSIFHRSRCRGFNWAQEVSIFVECNMQSSDLSNQILVRCRLHSDAATDSW